MNLVIGGAYQGKLEFAMETFGYQETDVYTCKDESVDFSRPCIDKIEEFTFACVEKNIDPVEYFKAHEDQWSHSTLICRDIFCGVVPLGADVRKWRHSTGLLCQYLSRKADRVSRIFCGLEQRLK